MTNFDRTKIENYERTTAEKVFWRFEKTINDTFYHHPALDKGIVGWVLRQLGAPYRLYRHKIWIHFAYNKDGRLTNKAALGTLGVTILVLIVLSSAIFMLFAFV